MKISEAEPFSRHSIDVRRRYLSRAVATDIRIAQIVHENKDDVGAAFFSRGYRDDSEQERDEVFHGDDLKKSQIIKLDSGQSMASRNLSMKETDAMNNSALR